jgi:transcriptional regulator GlxA family with amidase domain
MLQISLYMTSANQNTVVIEVVDPLQLLAHKFSMNLYILSSTLDRVTTEPASAAMNPYNSSFWLTINPTHTFATAPDDLEVLIVPGGPGVRAPDVSPMTDFIRDRYPKLRYLLTVCTGAGLAAKSGVLDGRKATTNKAAWATITAYGPNTTWVSPARWVVDGNIWTSSGVSCSCFHISSSLVSRLFLCFEKVDVTITLTHQDISC